MCIVTVTSSHKDYPLILVNNRDEYLQRPTAMATWWDSPYEYVLGGRDMHRAERGTWLGITKQGRLACLTNFREEGQAFIEGRRSRGAVVNAFLKTDPTSKLSALEAAQALIDEGLDGIGGFSLLYGQLTHEFPSEKCGLEIISNRSTSRDHVKKILETPGQTRALSNSHFGDDSWPKVVNAEKLVVDGVQKSMEDGESQEKLIERMLGILHTDTLPKRKVGEDFEIYLRQLRHSIFVPACGDQMMEDKKDSDQIAAYGTPSGTAKINPTGGVYGTQKQTIILVDKNGRVTFFERTLFDQLGKPITPGEGDRKFEFDIEGW